MCQVEKERVSFLDDLVAAARDPERRAIVLVALRADFYGRLASYPRFGDLLSASHLLVGPMDSDELTRAVEQPAARAALELESGLADALVSNVVGEAGGGYRCSRPRCLSCGARVREGSCATAAIAEAGVSAAPSPAWPKMRTPGSASRNSGTREPSDPPPAPASGDAERPVRRRVPLTDLERLEGATPVIAALTNARLLTISDGEVELSHEALLHEWPRYRTLLDEDSVGRRLHGHLSRSARDWEATDHDPGDLYRGARLTGALDWAGQHTDELTPTERRFLTASRRHADHTARRLAALLAGVVLLVLAALVAGAIALVEKERAAREARLALARQLDAEAMNEPQPGLALLLAREAITLERSPQTESLLLATLQRSPGGLARRFAVGGPTLCCDGPAPGCPAAGSLARR